MQRERGAHGQGSCASIVRASTLLISDKTLGGVTFNGGELDSRNGQGASNDLLLGRVDSRLCLWWNPISEC